MKLDSKLVCPHCGQKNAHAYIIIDKSIWDDNFYKMLNRNYPDDDKFNCDTITYKCHCENPECNKAFISHIKLKCEIDDILYVDKEEDLAKTYFKKHE